MEKQTFVEAIEPGVWRRLVSRREAVRAGLIAAAATGSVPVMIAAMSKQAFAQGTSGVTAVLNFALTLEYLESEFYDIATGQTPLPSQYTGSVALFGGTGAPPKPVFDEIAKHENAHVADLKAALGSAAVAKPTFDFTGGMGATNAQGKFTGPFADVFSNPATFLTLSQAFEDTGVRAYKGQAPNLAGNVPVLETALQIHSIEARHASEVRRLRGQKGWPSGDNGVPAAAQPIYGPGTPPADFPAESNTTQAGVNVANLAGVSASAAAEAFDEPLDMATVLQIASLFIKA